MESREFIGWDGEGYTEYVANSSGEIVAEQRYMLFGNSLGEKIVSRSLGTEECLDLILQTERENPKAIHVGFATEYDVNMWLKDLDWRYLAMLYDTGSVKWKGYRLKHTPDKFFTVSKKGISATIYNVFGFFHCSYMKALDKYEIGSKEKRERIKRGKDKRGMFTLADIDEVTDYWTQEISLLPPLMEKLREAAYSAGFFITEWHGPGALASYALKQNKSSQYKSGKVPTEVRMARSLAYAGGRFQAWKCGLYIGPVYTADINSAYAYAASLLPRLDNGTWRNVPKSELDKREQKIKRFGLYHISFSMPNKTERKVREHGIPMPLFHRDKKGRLTWPMQVDNWYWSPEAATVANSPYANIIEAIEYEDDETLPFEWISSAFARRLQLQEVKHPAEKAYKWMLAAMYGQWAQRVGWDKEKRLAPKSHQLEWAGFITSMCRALVFRAAMQCARSGSLISIDTDGVTSMTPFDPELLPNGEGKELGQWKLEEYTGILYWQNGIYWLRDMDGNWVEPKTRGVPRGSLDVSVALETMKRSSLFRDQSAAEIEVKRHHFVGYAQAMQNQFNSWRLWLPRKTQIVFGGSGKGRHIPKLCSKCTVCGNIPLHTITHFPPGSVFSEPHKLPWLETPAKPEQNVTDLIWKDELL